MTVDLKWADAMAVAGQAFVVDERKAGWPDRLMPHQLARLQRPFSNGDKAARNLCFALGGAIQQACEAGQLAHTVTSKVVQRQWSKDVPVRFESMYYDGTIGKIRTVHGSKNVDVKTLHIEAVAFAEWLHKQGEEPSQHIAHWFKVRGVTRLHPIEATATSASNVVSLREPAPAIEPEAGWTKATKEGEHLVAEHGDGDRRLVQLSTLFRWVVDRSDAPPSVALERALALVADIPTGALYLLQKEGWPATFTEGQALPGFSESGYVDLEAPAAPSYGHGMKSLIDLMHEVWVDTQGGNINADVGGSWLDHLPGAHEYLCRLAVPIQVAHRLWGWGRLEAPAVDAVAKPSAAPLAKPTTWASLVAWPVRKEAGFVWTDDFCGIVAKEKQRRKLLSHTCIAEAMGKELGCSSKWINELIQKIGRPGKREQALGSTIHRISGTKGGR